MRFVLLLQFLALGLAAQVSIDNPGQNRQPYDRKAEVVHQYKRYRKWNNYVTGGAGFAISPQRTEIQRLGGGDFNFHLRDQYLQFGGFISGTSLAYAKNNLQLHLGYGKRFERNYYNIAFFAGPSYSYGFFLIPDTSSSTQLKPEDYSVVGAYASAQFVYKVKYDIGVGLELFADYNSKQQLFGGKIILFFSGAYRGYIPGYKPRKRFSYEE
jgi:hypothetical protein